MNIRSEEELILQDSKLKDLHRNKMFLITQLVEILLV